MLSNEIKDKIFFNMSSKKIRECKEIVSEYVYIRKEYDNPVDAALHCNLTCLKYIKNYLGKDIHDKVFLYAIRRQNFEMIDYLIDCVGKSIRLFNDKLLRTVAYKGNLKMMIYYINKGANVRCLGNCILHNSIELGYFDVVEYLVSTMKIDPNIGLRTAAKMGNMKILKFLISSGADYRANNYGALHNARKSLNNEMILYLVELGSRIWYNDGELLYWSIKTKNLRIFDLFVKENTTKYSLYRHLQRVDKDLFKYYILHTTTSNLLHLSRFYNVNCIEKYVDYCGYCNVVNFYVNERKILPEDVLCNLQEIKYLLSIGHGIVSYKKKY